MAILFRLMLALIAPAASFFVAASAQASGAYSCCFVDTDGKRVTRTGRASSFYKGSIERLCRVRALDEGVKQCNPAVTDMAADLDFTKGPLPERYGLSKSCKTYPCTIGMLLAGAGDDVDEAAHFDLAVTNAGLTCSVEKQINGAVDGWVVSIATPKVAGKTVKPGASCTVVRLKGGKEAGRLSLDYGPSRKSD